jgi:hypothetical protein
MPRCVPHMFCDFKSRFPGGSVLDRPENLVDPAASATPVGPMSAWHGVHPSFPTLSAALALPLGRRGPPKNGNRPADVLAASRCDARRPLAMTNGRPAGPVPHRVNPTPLDRWMPLSPLDMGFIVAFSACGGFPAVLRPCVTLFSRRRTMPGRRPIGCRPAALSAGHGVHPPFSLSALAAGRASAA